MLFLFYFMEGYIGISPSVYGLVRELSSVGHEVEVRGVRNEFAEPGALPSTCRIVDLPAAKDRRFFQILYALLRYLRLSTLIPVIDVLWFALQSLVLDLRSSRERRGLRRVNVGIDARGAITALVHFAVYRRQFVYLSLEVARPEWYRRLEKLIPLLERGAFKHCNAVVIQDDERLRTLSSYVAHLPDRVFFLPNAPLGTSPETIRPCRNYLRELLKIDSTQCPYIALHAGMIMDEVYAQELTQAFADIDCGFALVLHERHVREPDEPYIQLLRRSNTKNLFLSLRPVPLDEVDEVFLSATIGLVFYRPINENFASVTYASGKLAFFLKHGIPVLMNRLAATEALIEKYRIGVLVTDPSNSAEITAGLKTILSEYEAFSTTARECFHAEFDFASKAGPICAFLESL